MYFLRVRNKDFGVKTAKVGIEESLENPCSDPEEEISCDTIKSHSQTSLINRLV